MATVEITADIDFDASQAQGRAVFSTLLFVAGIDPITRQEDVVRWTLRGADGGSPSLGGFQARVKFLSFPPKARAKHEPLLDGGSGEHRDTFEAVDNVITGTGREDAPAGRYGYVIELARGTERVELDCVWRQGPDALVEVPMTGGKPPEPPIRKAQ